MKSCPQCQRVFPNDAGFCPADGTALTTASMAPVAPSADDPRIGTMLVGRYEVRRVVADGGMGRVYEGIDKQNDARIAVKILHEDVAKDEVSLERFKS
jgi:serine/threonine-protein kinase